MHKILGMCPVMLLAVALALARRLQGGCILVASKVMIIL